MKKVSLALFLSIGALAGAAYAQDRPPVNTVVESTDPDAVAQVEQHARDAQDAAASSEMTPAPHKPHHRRMHKPMSKPDTGASAPAGNS